MGLLSEDDWHARWIGADTNSQTLLLRRGFSVKPKLKRAIAFVAVSVNTKCHSMAEKLVMTFCRPAGQNITKPVFMTPSMSRLLSARVEMP